MKIRCTYPGCSHTAHRITVKIGLPWAGEKHNSQWFCSRRCYRNYLAETLIEEKRNSVQQERHRIKLGALLLKNHIIHQEQLYEALEEHHRSLKKLGQILIESGHITVDQLKAALSMQSGIAPISLDPNTKMRMKSDIPFKFIDEFHFILFEFDPEAKVIAIALYNIDYLPYLEHFFSSLYPHYLCKFYLEEQTRILSVIAHNYPDERLSLPLESKLAAPGSQMPKNLEQLITSTKAFLLKLTGEKVELDHLDNAVWLKGKTNELHIDVYITEKRK